ncbi:MAG: DedA family protein [Culicoidibacterales bacterium]
MDAILLQLIDTFGYFGIGLLIAIENIFPPIPSEIILTFGGFLTTTTELSIVGVTSAATIGSVIGALILYWLGTRLTQARLELILASPFVQRLGFKQSDVAQTIIWFEKYETKAVFLGRFIPIIRSLISLPAGIAKMNCPLFILYTTLGSLSWNVVLISLGAGLGESWQLVAQTVSLYSRVIVIILGIVIILSGYSFWKKRQSIK